METIKILIVTDRPGGGFSRPEGTPPNNGDFHLGEFMKVLNDTSWNGFNIDITTAHRTTSAFAPNLIDLPSFNFATHDLMQYDEILLFPIARDDSSSNRISSAEVEAISEFMDAGGGVFATGDHEDLGAGMCREIPRVRNMRRWYFGNLDGNPAAPSGSSADRFDTTRKGFDAAYQFNDQSDNIAQEISPEFFPKNNFSRRFAFSYRYPHPLLCSPDGIIRYLPDHAHEGQCEVPSDLTKTVFGKDEYPKLPSSNTRLAPVVVANATVIGGNNVVNNDGVQIKPPVNGRHFGVIGAYDGHRIVRNNKRLGRIVVDATWHHFFNINLKGASAGGNDGSAGDPIKERGFLAPLNPGQADHYKMIKHYFRNIIYWLIPAKRTIFTHLGVIERFVNTGYFYEELRFDYKRFDQIPLQVYFHIAHLAESYFKSVRGECARLFFTGEILREIDPIREILDKIGPVVDPWLPEGPRPSPQIDPEPFLPRFKGIEGTDMNRIMLGATVASFLLADQDMPEAERNEKDFTIKRAEAFEKMLPEVTQHAFGEFNQTIKSLKEEQEKSFSEIQDILSSAIK